VEGTGPATILDVGVKTQWVTPTQDAAKSEEIKALEKEAARCKKALAAAEAEHDRVQRQSSFLADFAKRVATTGGAPAPGGGGGDRGASTANVAVALTPETINGVDAFLTYYGQAQAKLDDALQQAQEHVEAARADLEAAERNLAQRANELRRPHGQSVRSLAITIEAAPTLEGADATATLLVSYGTCRRTRTNARAGAMRSVY